MHYAWSQISWQFDDEETWRHWTHEPIKKGRRAARSLIQLYQNPSLTYSDRLWLGSGGVTGVGVTRGGNWWVSPLVFLEKIWRPFLIIASESYYLFLAVISLPSSHFHGVHPVLSKIQPQKLILRRVSPPCRVLPGAVRPSPPALPPPSDATGEILDSWSLKPEPDVKHAVWKRKWRVVFDELFTRVSQTTRSTKFTAGHYGCRCRVQLGHRNADGVGWSPSNVIKSAFVFKYSLAIDR